MENQNQSGVWLLLTTDLVLGLVVELVGQSGEVVPDLFTHRDGDLLALAGLREGAAHQDGGEQEQQLHVERREETRPDQTGPDQLQFIVWLLLAPTD